jgi:hypothetical protein
MWRRVVWQTGTIVSVKPAASSFFTDSEDGDRRFLRNVDIKLHDVTSQNILTDNSLLND